MMILQAAWGIPLKHCAIPERTMNTLMDGWKTVACKPDGMGTTVKSENELPYQI